MPLRESLTIFLQLGIESILGSPVQTGRCSGVSMASREMKIIPLHAQQHLADLVEIDWLQRESPWTREVFESQLNLDAVAGIVVITETGVKSDPWRVSGFLIYHFSTGLMQVLNMAVLPRDADRGVGRKLIESAKCLARRIDSKVVIHVRERDVDKCVFLRDQGFLFTEGIDDTTRNGDQVYRFEFEEHAQPC